MVFSASTLAAEVRREFLLWRSYRAAALGSLVMWGVGYPLLVLILSNVMLDAGQPFGEEEATLSLIGFLVWQLCMSVLAAVPRMIEDEARVGTLENLLIVNGNSLTALLLQRILARSVRAVVETAVLGVVLMLLFRVTLPFSLGALLVVAITLMGVWGVGLGLAGLAIVHKNVGSMTGIFSQLAIITTGAFYPLNWLGIAFLVIKFVIPTAWGIDLLRDLMVREMTMGGLLRSGEFIGLTAQSTIFLIGGWLLFRWGLGRARELGTLMSY